MDQLAKPLTTKVTKAHEGKSLRMTPSGYFVSLVVAGFACRVVKLTHGHLMMSGQCRVRALIFGVILSLRRIWGAAE